MTLASEMTAIGGTLAAGLVDARTGYIPDAISRGTAFAALAVAVISRTATPALGGAVLVGGLLVSLYLLTRGRGLGLGDVKLGVAIGAGCGPGVGSAALGAAFVLGGIYASWLLATGRAARDAAIPFAPFLAAGTVAACAAAAQVAP